MEELTNYLLQFQSLNKQQIDLVLSKVEEHTIEKDAYFSEAGKIPRAVAFVLDGIFRVCYFNKEGEEITKYFIDENNFAVDINSYGYGVPSSEYIQAVVKTKILVFHKSTLDELSETIVPWDSMISKIISKALIEKVSRISPMMAEDAKTRYIEFLNRFPTLANRVPLNHLASYIGITKSSLSRIRREIR